jgi:hypothetical protein
VRVNRQTANRPGERQRAADYFTERIKSGVAQELREQPIKLDDFKNRLGL